MSDEAIRVEGLGKKYRLGAQRQSYGSLRDSLTGLGKRFLPSGKEARGVRKPEFWALKDVGFEVKHGEVLGIIGRNGAGKSTLLKLLSEITEPTKGRITMNGRVASLLEVGTGFHPELSGRENVFLNGAILGMDKSEISRKFDEIVSFAEVERFIDTQVKHYSSGMYLRLAFAVAAHLEPEILMVDEVLAVGDSAFQEKCLGKMSAVAHEGRTILFVSHNLSSIAALTRRCLVLDKGCLVFDGDTLDAVQTYASHSLNGTSHIADLRNTRSITGNEYVVATHIWFEDEHGAVLHSILNGRVATVCIRYHAHNAKPIGKLTASIGFVDAYGTHLFLHRTNFSNQDFYGIPSEGVLALTINRFPLVQGTYSIVLYLEANGDASYLVSDAIRVSVENGDFFGTGSPGLPSHCKVLFDGDWAQRTDQLLPRDLQVLDA